MATKKISDLQVISAMADDVNIPGENTSQTYRVTGAQLKAYIQAQIADLMKQAKDLYNLGLMASVSGNALTIALKQLDGSSDPSSSAPVRVGFRGTTAANGDSSLVSATAATSLVISSGSTLGFSNGVAGKIYVYALNNGGTIELAASGSPWDEGTLQTTTAEGGAGAADSGTVLYSTTARTSKAIRLIGIITISEATAGTWASAPTEIAVAAVSAPRRAPTQQRFTSGSGNYTVPTPAPLYLRVRMVGGGGGGSCSGGTGGTASTDGASSTFGSSLLTAGGGAKGVFQGSTGGSGGSATINAPAYGTAIAGGAGNGYQYQVTGSAGGYLAGGVGGASGLGGNGASGAGGVAVDALHAAANSGAGGGGAGGRNATGMYSGNGGGAGGFIDAIIPNPAAGATYAYSVGAKGTGGTAGTSPTGNAGGNGGDGYIEVTEYWQ